MEIGNLHITGTTTEVSSDTMTITDPFIVLNNFSAVPTNNAYDTGFVFIRGTQIFTTSSPCPYMQSLW